MNSEKITPISNRFRNVKMNCNGKKSKFIKSIKYSCEHINVNAFFCRYLYYFATSIRNFSRIYCSLTKLHCSKIRSRNHVSTFLSHPPLLHGNIVFRPMLPLWILGGFAPTLQNNAPQCWYTLVVRPQVWYTFSRSSDP